MMKLFKHDDPKIQLSLESGVLMTFLIIWQRNKEANDWHVNHEYNKTDRIHFSLRFEDLRYYAKNKTLNFFLQI